MCLQWTRVLYSVVITRQSNPPISQFNSPCNEFTSVWSMFVYNTLSTNNGDSFTFHDSVNYNLSTHNLKMRI